MNSLNLPTNSQVEKFEITDIIDRKGLIGTRGVFKLNDQQRFELIDYLAKGYTPGQIIQIVKKNHDIDISYSTIYYYQCHKGWKKKIKELRGHYAQNIHLIPGANKVVRLARMEHVIDQATDDGDLRTVINANEQQRKEFEKDGSGDVTNIYMNNPVYNQLNMLPNDELMRRHREATQKMKLLQNETKEVK